MFLHLRKKNYGLYVLFAFLLQTATGNFLSRNGNLQQEILDKFQRIVAINL